MVTVFIGVVYDEHRLDQHNRSVCNDLLGHPKHNYSIIVVAFEVIKDETSNWNKILEIVMHTVIASGYDTKTSDKLITNDNNNDNNNYQ